MAAPYDNIPGIDSTDNFHPDVRQALAASPEIQAEVADLNAGGRFAGNSTLISDWNNAIETGFYKSSTALNAPIVGPTKWFIGYVEAHISVTNNLYVTQTVHEFVGDSSTNTKMWRRSCENDVWGAWYVVMISQAELDLRYQALITAGTTAQYYRGDKTWQTLNSTAVGLGNVNNTSDVNKPVSTAQAAADDLLAKGLLLKNEVGSSSGGVADAIVNNIATFTFKGGRRYRVVWDTSYYQTATGDLFYWSIGLAPTADAASYLGNITVMSGRTKGVGMSGTGVTQHTGAVTAYYNPSSDTTQQVKFRIQRVVGGGSTVVVGNLNEKATYLIYDDGAQTLFT